MTTQHPNSEAIPPGWERSPPDTVLRLGKRLRGRKARRQFLRGAGATAVGLMVTGGAFALWWATREPKEYDYGGITCSRVRSRMNDMMAMKLPPAEVALIREHLALCPRCRPLLDTMKHSG